MDRSQKANLVSALNTALADTDCVVITHQSGLTVAEATELRRQMRAAGAQFRVTKNRLARRALEGTKFERLSPLFTGPTAIAFSRDPVAAAKVAVAFADKNDKLTIVGGGLGERELDVDAVKALAALPSLEELRSRLIGLLQTPASR
ncbi:MAG: 50S ribosomal protein L10, partial [Stellaceae bacterium]